MTQKILSAPAETLEARAASTADGGTALTSTAGLIVIPEGTDYIQLTPHSFANALVAKWALNPRLTIIHTRDLLTSPAFDNFSDELQDGDATDVTIDPWDTLANGDALYVGSELPFRGAKIVIGTTVNDLASVLTIKYWNGGAWIDLANSEGTKVVGDCLKQSGDETWTVPADWAAHTLIDSGDTELTLPLLAEPKFWTRWEVSAILTASFDIRQLLPYNRSTAYYELLAGQTRELSVPRPGTQFVCVEALTNDGTASLIVNVATKEGF